MKRAWLKMDWSVQRFHRFVLWKSFEIDKLRGCVGGTAVLLVQTLILSVQTGLYDYLYKNWHFGSSSGQWKLMESLYPSLFMGKETNEILHC